MSDTRFTWDEAKNLSNQKKHDGIGFEVAAHVFNDPLRLMLQDRIEEGEERWQTLGVVYGVNGGVKTSQVAAQKSATVDMACLSAV